jgi:mannose-6-phosphate isomerase-like protein (cupin superfamily)
MLNLFYSAEYPAVPGVHEDNEGFYVISGRGSIKIEEREYELIPGTAILVPAGLHHALRKTGNEDLKVFIYHFPVSENQ